MDKYEELIGRAEGLTKLESGENTFSGRPLCANCRGSKESKRLPVHCLVTKSGEVKVRCNSPLCECRCRTHYICRVCARLHPYGQGCDYSSPAEQKNNTLDKFVNDLNKSWKELN